MTGLEGELNKANERSHGLEGALGETTAALEANELAINHVQKHVDQFTATLNEAGQHELECGPNHPFKQLVVVKAAHEGDTKRLNAVIWDDKDVRITDNERLSATIQGERLLT